jgi:uncharacterized protein YprB with RNaseH-like and TPR domain
MLWNTFQHIPGIGAKTEEKLWKMGILAWDEFLMKEANIELTDKKKLYIRNYILLSYQKLAEREVGFFSGILPKREHWRIYSDFKEKTAFLDIETTGLFKNKNDITVISLYGSKIETFVKGKNLKDFSDAVKKYQILVTFNGANFDIPFLKENFSNFDPLVHIDLRYLLKRIGITGGLKNIERLFGINRRSDIKGICGFDAILLWKKYLSGDENSLEKLVWYNVADTVNLKIILEKTIRMLEENCLGEDYMRKSMNDSSIDEIFKRVNS